MRVALVAAMVLVGFAATNVTYQVMRKPSEMFFPLGNALDKKPAETWRQYGVLFREYSTANITAELLAALAQVESAGNPVARTYWRWRLTWRPFAIYGPASSAVGMFQMTDPALADARPFCVRRHEVVEEGCWFNGLYSRILPSHAIELAAVFLDRNVASILRRHAKTAATPQQKQNLAAIVHLCGAGAASAYARRGFRLIDGERCGDHDAARYVAKVNAMRQAFRRIAANP